jgi:hypothetical protein
LNPPLKKSPDGKKTTGIIPKNELLPSTALAFCKKTTVLDSAWLQAPGLALTALTTGSLL